MPLFEPGQVVLILFPFTDTGGAKKRPALVLLDAGDDDILVARITAQPRQTVFDCELRDWPQAALKTASTVRLHKLATLNKQLVDRTLGHLSPADWQLVCRSFQQVSGAMRPSPSRVGRADGAE